MALWKLDKKCQEKPLELRKKYQVVKFKKIQEKLLKCRKFRQNRWIWLNWGEKLLELRRRQKEM